MTIASHLTHFKRYLPIWVRPTIRKIYQYILTPPFSPSAAKCAAGVSRFHEVQLSHSVEVAFLDLFPIHYQFTRPVIELVAQKRPVILIVTSKSHPVLTDKSIPVNIYPVLIEGLTGRFLKQIKINWLVTAASHIHACDLPRNVKAVHLYHSLVSMHVVYGDNGFDAFTHFFACGPHHVREIESFSKLRHWPRREIFEIGYPKVDEIAKLYRQSAEPNQTDKFKTVLLAPSWHTENLLKQGGVEMVEVILGMGFNLIIRPHPHAYTFDRQTIASLEFVACKYPGRCVIEDPASGQQSLLYADLMISDWSGVAYEYAFATERPVLFIDAPQKVASENWRIHGLPAMEDVCRAEIGVIIKNVGDIKAGLQDLTRIPRTQWTSRIREARQKYLFNFLSSAEVSAKSLLDLMNSMK